MIPPVRSAVGHTGGIEGNRIMKNLQNTLLIVVVLICLFTVQVFAQVNVTTYGAKGDGTTDDTEAIRKAMSAASIQVSQPSPIGCYYQTGPALVFPAGEYIVSDEIPVTALEMRAEGRAVLRQKNKEKNILTSAGAWRLRISNITFLGGRDQIHLYNPNMDTGQIIIEGCRFYGAAGFGLWTDVKSTTVRVSDCEFLSCRQSWYNASCDQAAMNDCWIMSDSAMEDKAVIEHRAGRLTINNLVGVPLVGGARQRWIDNYGMELSLIRCRFGGEGGGFTPVYNFAKYSNINLAGRVVFEDCLIGANASYNANCAIYCYEMPNLIRIRDCSLGGSTGVIIDKRIDLNNYFENVQPGLLSYSVDGCAGELIEKLPNGLVKPVIKKTAPTKRILSARETAQALAAIKKELGTRNDPACVSGVANGHAQRVENCSYVDLTDWTVSGRMDATVQPNGDWLALERVGSDTVIIFKQGVGGWPHTTINATVDVDKYPWLTWHQKKGTSPGSFALKVIDRESGTMKTLYAETFGGEYDYHADNLKKIFGFKGTREIEIRWYPLGCNQNGTATTSDWTFAKAGDYIVMDFMRMESD
jgi:hypothetical protein